MAQDNKIQDIFSKVKKGVLQMSWRKRAIISSLIWVIFLFIWSVGSVWYINSHPLPPGMMTQGERSRKLGEGVGFALGCGVLAIWVYEFKKNSKKKQE